MAIGSRRSANRRDWFPSTPAAHRANVAFALNRVDGAALPERQPAVLLDHNAIPSFSRSVLRAR
jgi:hypothetical protein